MEGLAGEMLKAFGPAGIVLVILLIGLNKSEKREARKDERIQLLENKLTESYDERITAADQITSAQIKLAQALTDLTNEIRATRRTR